MMNNMSKDKQSATAVTQELIVRLNAHQETPCFIVAPPQSGERELFALFSKELGQDVLLSRYEVNAQGQCNTLDKQLIPAQTQGDFLGSQGSVVLKQGSTHTLEAKGTTKKLTLILWLPWLDDDAAERLSDAIDALVASGEQVIILCSVQNDRYQNLQSDRVEITIEELRSSSLLLPSAQGVSLARFLEESLPVQIRLAAALTGCLGRVKLDELAALGYILSGDILRLLVTLSPLFEADEATGEVAVRSKIDPQDYASGLIQVMCEYLDEEGITANDAAVAARITALSIYLLQKGDLEASHHLLEIAEGLIERRNQKPKLDHTVIAALPLFAGSQHSVIAHMQQKLRADVVPALKEKAATSQVVVREGAQTMQPVEPLHLGLFGEFKVILAGQPLNNKNLSRSKVRRLMSYLALNQQRMVSREVIIDYLWPYLDFERAQKNLYTSWCMLAKGLGSESTRECPYIQRRGELYQINAEYIECDTRQFERSAREVLLGHQDIYQQVESLAYMESLYRDALVADLSPDSFITAKEKTLRSLMVDSFLVVIRQLREVGEIEKAVFYARAAYELDDTREDVYRELMDTQNTAGQRTSAMQTYFSCKQYLSDELGILPSRSTTALYQDLLLDNCR